MENEMIQKALKHIENNRLLYWFKRPDPENDDHDDVWHEHPVFNNGEVEVSNRVEWYESPNVPTIYKDHKHIFSKNMDLTRPFEEYFYQNVDSNEFRSKMSVGDPDQGFGTVELPSELGHMIIRTRIRTKTPPSGDNEFALVEYFAQVYIEYHAPQGITILPRILSRPLNRFFKWAFLQYIGNEAVEEDGEFARQQLTEYFQYLRKYHGEEPVQTKTRLEEAPEIPDDGTFFE